MIEDRLTAVLQTPFPLKGVAEDRLKELLLPVVCLLMQKIESTTMIRLLQGRFWRTHGSHHGRRKV